MRNRSVHLFALLLLAALTQPSHSSYAQKKKPNVLFIAVDDLKPFLEPYGDKIVKSPAISKIASRGMVFERNYCQQAVCAPTRASLLTGLRPDRTGVWDLKTNFRLVDSTIVSLPEYLRSQGYETAGYGKIYHEAPETTFAGHDPKSWSVPYVKLTAPVYVLSDKKPSVEYADVHDTTYLDGKLAAGAIHALGNLAKGDKPFFLAVGFKKPHLPFVAPKRYWDLYRRDQFTVDPFQEKARNSPGVAYHISGELKSYSDIPDFDSYSDVPEKKLSVEKQKELLHGYYASISYTDAQVQKLLDEIDRLGLRDNTVIVLWGDHGWHLGDHGLWNKHSNFENATRSTLLFSVPWIKGGIKTSSLTEFVDVYPTIVDLLDLPIPADLDGRSIVPILRNPKAVVHQFAVSQYPRPDGIMGYTIRTDKYRLTLWFKDYKSYQPYDPGKIVAREFYDYERDPRETVSEIDNPAYKKQIDDLSGKLQTHLTQQYHVSQKHSGVAAFYQKKVLN